MPESARKSDGVEPSSSSDRAPALSALNADIHPFSFGCIGSGRQVVVRPTALVGAYRLKRCSPTGILPDVFSVWWSGRLPARADVICRFFRSRQPSDLGRSDRWQRPRSGQRPHPRSRPRSARPHGSALASCHRARCRCTPVWRAGSDA